MTSPTLPFADPNPADTGLQAITTDPDLYALPLASDTPITPHPRGHQTESQFLSQKKTYTPLQPQLGDSYAHFVARLDELQASSQQPNQANDSDEEKERAKKEEKEKKEEDTPAAPQPKPRLSKKDFALLGYAVGELYYLRRFREGLDLVRRVGSTCGVDAKAGESLGRWEGRFGGRLEGGG
ncbi:hypothetical protein MBLNU230_g1559t1 [Neophaeotheca triangularis]